MEYNICTGDDPRYILSLPAFGRGFIELFSAALHVYTHVRITIYKYRKSQQHGPENRANFLKNLTISDIDSQSLTNFTLNFCCFILVVSGVLIISLLQVKSCDDLLDNHKSLTLLFSYVLFPNICVGITLIMYFFHKKTILKTVWREFKENIEFRGLKCI